eukprot:TRINITY_DN6151_c0_g1_i2.p1 TRINITY_DN6151_c0_g1~~TRINITY_DN6151_c0_g1_i2.p1  ORF type:complete len:584 (+),score=125.82 TRINITY_DN6151_c0_g1_i2:73-1824(+)
MYLGWKECILSVLLFASANARPAGLATYTPSGLNFNCTQFISWIGAQQANGTNQLAIAPGTYNVYYPPPGRGDYYDKYPLYLQSMSNFALWMDDVVMVFMDPSKGGAWYLIGCENITMYGLTLRFNTRGFSQGRIINIQPKDARNTYVDFQIMEGYPIDNWYYSDSLGAVVLLNTSYLPIQNDYTSAVGLRTQSGYYNATALSADRKTLRWTLMNQFISVCQCSTGQTPITVGSYAVVRNSPTAGHLIYIRNGRNISLVNVEINESGTFGIAMTGGYGGHTLDNVRLTYGPTLPGIFPPLGTTSADGIHTIGLRNGVTIKNSLVEGTLDDCVNLQNVYFQLQNITSAGYIFAVNPAGARSDYCQMLPGDTVRLFDNKMVPMGKATVRQATNLKGAFWNPQVNFTETLGQIAVGWLASNLNCNGRGFLLENNTFRNTGGRVIVRTSHGSIRNNHFSYISGNSLTPEIGYYFEGDYVENVTIENNWYDHADIGRASYQPGSIGVWTNNILYPNQVMPAGGHSHVTVRNNVIVGAVNFNMRFNAIDDLLIEGNVIVLGNVTQPPGISMKYCTNVTCCIHRTSEFKI